MKQISSILNNSRKDGESVLLIPGGDKLKVTNENIFDYVKRYATYKMVLKPEPAVKELRRGVHDVISESALNGLTPEDWWLLGILIKCETTIYIIFSKWCWHSRCCKIKLTDNLQRRVKFEL